MANHETNWPLVLATTAWAGFCLFFWVKGLRWIEKHDERKKKNNGKKM